MSAERIAELRRWHEEASTELHARGAYDTTYLGLDLHVPEHVFGPTPTSDLLGREVQRWVQPGNRVLDMGCGAGANALLAAQITDEVVAVDVNPFAVAATAANAVRNGLADRVRCRESDVFADVDGTFDVIVIDPPFRWFAARDVLELAFADENYRTLGRFVAGVRDHLRSDGFVLLFFGSTGDVAHLDRLLDGAGLSSTVLAERTIEARGGEATYWVRRVARGDGS